MRKPRITMSFNESEIETILNKLQNKSFLSIKFEKSKAILISRRERYLKNINKSLDKCNDVCYDCKCNEGSVIRVMTEKEVEKLIKRIKGGGRNDRG